MSRQWRSAWGQGGGHGPRAQALEGAPAQLVGANFKKKIRPRQISKYRLSIFYPGADAGFTKRGGGADPSMHWPPGAGDPRYATVSRIQHIIGKRAYTCLGCSIS